MNMTTSRYVYVVSSPTYRASLIYKIGCTKNPGKRLMQSRTWSPACRDARKELKFDITYDRVFLTDAMTHEDMLHVEGAFHAHFARYRTWREHPCDSEWFDFESASADVSAQEGASSREETSTSASASVRAYDPLREIDAFAASMPNIVRALSREEIARACACTDVNAMSTGAHTRARSSSIPSNMQLAPFDVLAHERARIDNLTKAHSQALSTAQEPIVAQIRAFLEDDTREAGYVIAPCGSGKTVMMCDALRKFMRESATTKGKEHNTNVIICAPVECIQKQWHKTLIRRHVFAREDMYIINGSQAGMSASECVDRYVHVCARLRCSSQSSRAKPICAIVTYASSHLLTRVIDACCASLMIFDEAHHLAGIVAQDETDGEGDGVYFGQGRTRTLAAEAAKLRIKRIALTYTPRIARIHERDISSGRKVEFLTMDDELVFGKQIARLDLRKLINDGILPDYRICAIRPHPQASASVSSRASTSTSASAHSRSLSRLSTIDNRSAQVGECILRAWIEYARDINHLIIFARTLNDVRELGAYLHERAANTLVICVGESPYEDNVKVCIERFTNASRAILVNCYKLSEGVDIPCADSVAIAYAKESRGQITQMILRAGRWHPNKAMFRVLIPIIDDCPRSSATSTAMRPMNTTALTEVLVAMAINDSLIRDELKLRAQEQIASCSSSAADSEVARDSESPNKHIDLFCFASTDLARIRQIIAGLYVFTVAQGNSVDIRGICAAYDIRTSVDYTRTRANMFPDLPEQPWKHVGKTPYAFLNGLRAVPLLVDFRQNMRVLGITMADQYATSLRHAREGTLSQLHEWRGSLAFADYPDVQHILDCCFGAEYNQFADAIGPQSGRRTW